MTLFVISKNYITIIILVINLLLILLPWLQPESITTFFDRQTERKVVRLALVLPDRNLPRSCRAKQKNFTGKMK